jgi:hypothetical protein
MGTPLAINLNAIAQTQTINFREANRKLFTVVTQKTAFEYTIRKFYLPYG